MNIYCLTGLHQGVFQSLDGNICKHNFYVPDWYEKERKKPNNVLIMTKEMIINPYDNFFDAILIFPEHYSKVQNIDKTIIVNFLTTGREGQISAYSKNIISNPKVIPVFDSTSCRMSHGIYEGLHKTIYHGVDEEFWSGWQGQDKKIVHVRNNFKERDLNRYNDFIYVCGDYPKTLIGAQGDMWCGYEDLKLQLIKHRVYVNIDLFGSMFALSHVEAMMLGMPIVCNDIEGNGEVIRNGIDGFISNNMDYLKKCVNILMNDYDFSKEMGRKAREMAKIKFGKEQFNIQWNDFLNNIDYYRRK